MSYGKLFLLGAGLIVAAHLVPVLMLLGVGLLSIVVGVQ